MGLTPNNVVRKFSRILLSNVFFLGVCISVFSFSASSEQRELKSDAIEHIDAVLVLDNSGSMLLTDPKRLRDEGANLFIQFLKAGDRLSIVQFSKDAQVVSPLEDFDPTKIPEISKNIAKLDSTGQYTDLYAGLKVANEILQKNPRKDAKPVIVLLSDGKMDPDPAIATSSSRTNELFNGLLPDLKAQSVKVHTLSFSEEADRETLSQIAAGTEGIALYTPDPDQIHESYANLFLAVKKPQVLPLTSKGFKIDADVKEATFYINRENGAEVAIQDPSGKKLPSGVSNDKVRWFKGQKFDVITVYSPEPGDWQVGGLASQDGFATLLTNLKLVTDWPPSPNAEEDTLLQARLYESEKPVVLPEMTGAVGYGFQVTPTDKISEPVAKDFLHDDGKDGDKIANDGIFSATIRINDPGEYTLKVVAHAPTFDRYQQIPFRVKPRMIGISVAKHGKSAAVEHEKDTVHAEHGQGEHSAEDAHAAKPDEHNEEKAEASEEKADESGESEDFFIAKLSPETRELKNIEVNILAIGKTRERYTLALHETEDPFIYEIAASLLPEDGHYEVQAILSAQTKSKKAIKASSEKIPYLKKAKEGDVQVIKVESKTPKVEAETKTDSKPSSLPYIILVTLVNAALGGVVFVLMKKSAAQPKIAMPTVPPTEPIQVAIKSLRDRINVSEVNLDDPMFTGKGKGTSGAVAASAAIQQPAEAATAALTDVPAEEPPPPAETPPDEAAPPETPPATPGES